MQIIKAETLSIIASNNNSDDSDDDFLTLFGGFMVSEDPIPSMSWVEDELVVMEMANLDQPPQYCRDVQEEYHRDEALLGDMAIDRPSRQGGDCLLRAICPLCYRYCMSARLNSNMLQEPEGDVL
jgi:hypothetical protein